MVVSLQPEDVLAWGPQSLCTHLLCLESSSFRCSSFSFPPHLLGSLLRCYSLGEITLFNLGALPSPSSLFFSFAVTVILYSASLFLTPGIVSFLEGREEVFLQLTNELLSIILAVLSKEAKIETEVNVTLDET